MNKIPLFLLLPLFLFTGHLFAADLTGYWEAENLCTPCVTSAPEVDCIDGANPTVKREISYINLFQDGIYFNTSSSVDACGGLIIGKSISMTCPPTGDGLGTMFHGELKGPNIIEGINFNPGDGVTCSIVAIRLPDDWVPEE